MKKMNSTGNDIVALNQVNPVRTAQSRFYRKIISQSEYDLFRQNSFPIPFENYVWLLWSVKEAAFKFLQRSSIDLVFSPVKFVLTQIEFPKAFLPLNFQGRELEGTGFAGLPVVTGTITIGPHFLHSRSLIYHEIIVSVVNQQPEFEKTGWGIKTINETDPENQSAVVREFLITRLRKIYQSEALGIIKAAGGYPILMINKDELAIPVSLAHHDCWVAYSFKNEES